MKAMKYLGCSLLMPLMVWATETEELNPDAKKIIDVWLKSQMDYEKIPYLSASYVKEQSVLWSGTFGVVDMESGKPVEKNSISSICSTSKVITATAIMKLVDEGKLNLDQKITELLPRFAIQGKGMEDITVRSLLTHSSGLPRDTLHLYWSGPKHHFPTEDEFYDSLTQQKMQYDIDSKVAYSNVGYVLLGEIIQQLSNKTYKQYVETELFEALNMEDSIVEMPKQQYGINHVVGYSALNRDGKRRQANFYQTRAMQPAAGISTNAMDLAKFAKWQFRAMDAEKAEIISANTLSLMYKTDFGDLESNRGLGYKIQTDKKGDTWAMHGGMCPGYNSFFKMNLSKKQAFVFNTSANKVRALAYINNMIQIIARASSLKQSNNDNIELTQFEGFYDLSPWNSEYYIGKWGDGLVLLYLPVDSIKYAMHHYRHVKQDIFQLVKNGKLVNETIQFIRNSEGKVVSVLNDGGQHYKLR